MQYHPSKILKFLCPLLLRGARCEAVLEFFLCEIWGEGVGKDTPGDEYCLQEITLLHLRNAPPTCSGVFRFWCPSSGGQPTERHGGAAQGSTPSGGANLASRFHFVTERGRQW